MSATSLNANHGSVEANGQCHSVCRRFAKIEAPQQEPTGRSYQMLRYLNDDTCRPVTEMLQDPSRVPGARDRINLDNPLYSAPSHCSKSAPAHKNVLAEIGALFSEESEGAGRPAKLDPVDIAAEQIRVVT